MSAQDTLFERQEAAARAVLLQPHACPICHRTEPNWWLMQSNHGPDNPRALATGWCTAMDLTFAHVAYAVMYGHHADLPALVERARHRWAHRLPELDTQLERLGVTPDGRTTGAAAC